MADVEAEAPIDDWIEIGVFADAEEDSNSGEPVYLRMHRIRQMHRISSTEQTTTVTVPRRPARAGIDPYHVVIDLETDDNVEEVEIRAEAREGNPCLPGRWAPSAAASSRHTLQLRSAARSSRRKLSRWLQTRRAR